MVLFKAHQVAGVVADTSEPPDHNHYCRLVYCKICKRLRMKTNLLPSKYLHLCQALEDGRQPLFIAVRKPHKQVKAATIGHWLKAVMKKAGIDTGTFSAHSIQGAATSKVKSVGVSTVLRPCNIATQCLDWTQPDVLWEGRVKGLNRGARMS